MALFFFQAADFIKFEKDKFNYIDVRKGNFVGIIYFISSVFFAACFHIGCVPVINTLKNNVRRRIYKAIRRTILIDIVFYISVSVVGYLSVPHLDKGLIIQRCPTSPKGEDIVMGIGKIGLVFTFFTKLPNTYSSLRITLFDKIWGTTEITNTKNYIVTFIVIMVCVTVSIFYKDISSYVKIMGGILSTLVGFFFMTLFTNLSNLTNEIRNVFRNEEKKLMKNKKYTVTDKRKKEVLTEIDKILKKYKIKIIILIIIEFLLMLFFWYYVTAFCHVYNSTQYSWLFDSFLSILSRTVIDFLLPLGLSKLYRLAVESNIKCLYKIVLFFYSFA